VPFFARLPVMRLTNIQYLAFSFLSMRSINVKNMSQTLFDPSPWNPEEPKFYQKNIY
jgi:hypothetical protein